MYNRQDGKRASRRVKGWPFLVLMLLEVTSGMRRTCLTLVWPVLLAAVSSLAAESGPIALHPDNPHYFLWRGKPTILITSGEHYGAVLNRAFDYKPYLDTLQAHGFNLTRTFSGAYCEPVGAFKIERNTLAPAQGNLLCPVGPQRHARAIPTAATTST